MGSCYQPEFNLKHSTQSLAFPEILGHSEMLAFPFHFVVACDPCIKMNPFDGNISSPISKAH